MLIVVKNISNNVSVADCRFEWRGGRVLHGLSNPMGSARFSSNLNIRYLVYIQSCKPDCCEFGSDTVKNVLMFNGVECRFDIVRSNLNIVDFRLKLV